jgi:POT family proton-dependent oligopeptide transporter
MWIQIPAYVLIAISEIFASITSLEYAYNKVPNRMKSVVMSIFLVMTVLGNALHAALAPVAEDPKLVGNYTGVAVATFLAGIAFYLCFHKRDRIEEDENAIGKGLRPTSETMPNEHAA